MKRGRGWPIFKHFKLMCFNLPLPSPLKAPLVPLSHPDAAKIFDVLDELLSK